MADAAVIAADVDMPMPNIMLMPIMPLIVRPDAGMPIVPSILPNAKMPGAVTSIVPLITPGIVMSAMLIIVPLVIAAGTTVGVVAGIAAGAVGGGRLGLVLTTIREALGDRVAVRTPQTPS